MTNFTNLKALLAGAALTAAVTSALVLGTAVGAQASVFPSPVPVPPGPVNLPIYTQPSLPGFHLPSQLWTPTGPQVKPSAPTPYTVLPTNCANAVGPALQNLFASEGYSATSDTSVHATQDAQLLALMSGHRSLSCRWVQARTGAIVDVTDVVGVDDAAVAARLRALHFSEPGPTHGFQNHVDGVWYEQDVYSGQGGWALASATDNCDFFGLLMQDAPERLYDLNQ